MLSPGVVTLVPDGRPLLPAPALAKKVLSQRPSAEIGRIIVHDNPSRAAWISFTEGGERQTNYVEPTTGRLLGSGRGDGFFEAVTDIHRYMALPDGGNGWGRQMTGFAALSLVFFALSGLYLRWPKRPLDWRAWMVLDLRMSGRNLYRALHAVVGSWLILFYLVSALSGLWWSYGWYSDGLTRLLAGPEQAQSLPQSRSDDAEPDIAPAWRGFERATQGASYATVTASLRSNGTVQFRARHHDARHHRVSDELVIDGVTGAVISDVPYAQRSWGQDIIVSIYEIHRGAYFGLIGRIGLTISSLLMPLFTITGFLLYFTRRRRKRALRSTIQDVTGTENGAPALPGAEGSSTIVAFASQTGTAERLARLTASALPGASVLPIRSLNAVRLARTETLLVVAATYGEGEPPDPARSFARWMRRPARDLSHLRYAVLALGDREYPDFCAFGHHVDRWLHDAKAARLFDLVEMDGQDEDAQRQWQQQLGGLGARVDQPDWAPAPMEPWRLIERRVLNPGSHGAPAWHIALEPPVPGVSRWQAGDILEIVPRQNSHRIMRYAECAGLDLTETLTAFLSTRILSRGMEGATAVEALRPLPHREYSIASIAASDRVELIVRECVAEDGLPGLGSGWLTAGAAIGDVIEARVRTNPGFHPQADPSTPLLLIGNGTGLAGLLAHLRAREAEGGAPIWLFWGERHPDHDAFHREELDRLKALGVIAHAEFAWSRQESERAYVQDRLAARGAALRAFITGGAAIYVCGSIKGMAPAVHEALVEIVGDDVLEAMADSGRYRRDIY
ncbi:sulfite reductase (NADPH) flavoprotein alpha-component [Sphingobium sp. B7D2B]|uniref:sulfite reductase flavoprotein subunit alpha n=1 Tax=Sphingobium sp. B7D2B TaxID=2940583 RepID=UPI002224131A|nr:sulfite reductase flavoprotein subunit alpha [Sphingobium sp. B7D2B]MCW2365148.1 sulfite reductase (NADPH) flavoprotein alpha-component [Sphingobium sp. B7D2B]